MIVLTGATGGIGAALALSLAARGEHLVLTARDAARLGELAAQVRAAGGTARIHPCDLRDQQAVAELVTAVLADGVPDAVVALAGHSIRRGLRDTFGRPHDLVRLAGTNLLGPASLILALLEPMCARGSGRIVAVTSAATRIPTPGWAAYAATKAGLDTWLRALRPEAAAHGVGIAVVEMPLVATAMAAPTYGAHPRGAMSSEQAADMVLRALDTRRTLISPWWVRIGAVISQAAPTRAAHLAGRGGDWGARLLRRDRAPAPSRRPLASRRRERSRRPGARP